MTSYDPKGQGRTLNTSMTRPWPFRVTWRHRACDSIKGQYNFYGAPDVSQKRSEIGAQF